MPGLSLYRRRMTLSRIALSLTAVTCITLTASCGIMVERDDPQGIVGPGEVVQEIPKAEPRSRYGNPESYEVFGKRYYTLKTSRGFQERGIASWYGKKFHGRKTSSGEVYDMYQMTAAHKHLPLPTYVKVTNLENGRSTILKVNDRGPFHENRVIDLSYAAALELDVATKGTAFVEVTAINHNAPAAVADAHPKPQPAADDPGLYLQIGAFNERLNAQRLSQRVAQIVPKKVHIHESNNGAGSIYRVQVGPIATVEFADQLVDTLFGLGINEHHFVSN